MASAPADRPDCFGLGRDLNSRQIVPIDDCQRCEHDKGCSLLRQARALEGIEDHLVRLSGDFQKRIGGSRWE